MTKLQNNLFWPSTEIMEKYLTNNMIINCKLTGDDVRTRNNIYREHNQILKGKIKGRTTNTHTRELLMLFSIPKKYMEIDMFVYLFYVNKIVFLHTKTEHFQYQSIQAL